MSTGRRIFAVTVGRNEADRYLGQVLGWTRMFVDRHLYYDDGSVDISMDVAVAHGCNAMGSEGNRFLDDESEVREDAWRWVDKLFGPRPGDWILALDADEFLVVGDGSGTEREVLERIILDAEREGYTSISFPVREMFDWTEDDDKPMYRVDGFWGSISANRLAKWTGRLDFKPVELGGGSLPAGYDTPWTTVALNILHFGYARQEDREMKARRYAARPGVHNPAHIDSILRPPTLKTWDGRVPWKP